MPIVVERGPLRAISQSEFHELDHAVMRIVFDIHNEHGRFLDELLYKREIAERCLKSGIPCERERRIWVRYDHFEKVYKIDLVFSDGVIFEVKTVECFAPTHFAQTLNYVLLTETHHASLVNMRSELVERRFVSSQLTHALRKNNFIDEENWRNINQRSKSLKETMIALVEDWGTFLECNLYREALTYVLGGFDNVVQRIPVFSTNRELGTQEVHLVTEDTAFAVTAITDPANTMKSHLQRFLEHTRLNHMQWVNLNHHKIEFVTISK